MTDTCAVLHAKRLPARVHAAALCTTMDLAAYTLHDGSLAVFVSAPCLNAGSPAHPPVRACSRSAPSPGSTCTV